MGMQRLTPAPAAKISHSARLIPMQAGEGALARRESPPASRERPWLFNFLIAPDAVISLGLINGALSFLLRDEGVDPARAASLVALLCVPHAIYFFWGPVTDFWIRRRTWLLLASAASALTIFGAFRHRLASPLAVALLFAGACLGMIVPAACGGIMGELRSEVNRRRAGAFYQAGSLAFGGITTFVLVAFAQRLSLPALGAIVAALIALPALVAFAVAEKPVLCLPSAGETARRIAHEFKATFLRREAIPYTLLVTFPMCSGGMLGLLPELARDYGVNGSAVAWINGLAGVLLTAAGAVAVSLIPVRIRASVAFLLAGLANAATLAILALGPPRPAVYFTGTVLFLFTIGACYALFTAVALEFLGSSGKSGSARYSIINSLGNLPVAYMAWADGRGYAHWGPRAMPGTDAALSIAGACLLLTYFLFARRRTAPVPAA
jgi:MFS transporter, PAT family, beta-lactamase induction signal transducer AmpG